MKILLSEIKPSPKPIRSSWDEQAMKDLKWSLMEEGQVEPIGVYPGNEAASLLVNYGNEHEADDQMNAEQAIIRGHGKPQYVIVWGHRRVEAARRAAWEEIEAVIVPQDEVNNLIQSGIENLAGEDMSDDDKADWVYRLNIEFGLSLHEISRRSSVKFGLIQVWSNKRKQKELGVEVTRFGSAFHVAEITQALGDDLEAKKAVAERVSNDDFGATATRELARAYRDAPTPEVKAAVLRQPIISRDTAADILRRSVNRVQMDTGAKIIEESTAWEIEREEKNSYQAFDFAIKEFLDTARLFMEVARKGANLVKYGKYSPEA